MLSKVSQLKPPAPILTTWLLSQERKLFWRCFYGVTEDASTLFLGMDFF